MVRRLVRATLEAILTRPHPPLCGRYGCLPGPVGRCLDCGALLDGTEPTRPNSGT